jgi:predicted ferric reductase
MTGNAATTATTATATRARPQRSLSGPALLALYVTIALLPLLLALIAGKPARSFWRELASGLAMVGFAMLLLEFMLSGRYRGVSGRVGIDVTMRVHQLAAWGVLLFLLFHPFLYAVPRLTPDPMRAVASLERMFTSEWYRSGVIAWVILLLMVPLAALRDRLPFRYETWRASHGLGAALVAGLGLHHTLAVGSHSADRWLATFWAILAGLALLTLVHAYLLKPLTQRRQRFRVVSNRQVADRSFELVIRPDDAHSFHFRAGQFVWLNLGHSPFSLTEHPFSISSAPAGLPDVAFTIKQSGDFTNRIGDVPLGTRALVDGPHGSFVLPDVAVEGLAFIAGGVGFAPVMAILRQLRAERWQGPICVIYGNRVESQILYRDELETMAREMPLDLKLVLSEPPPGWTGLTGELTEHVLDTCLDPSCRQRWTHFVCGPPTMMNAVEHSLLRFGVPAGKIIAERFKYD